MEQITEFFSNHQLLAIALIGVLGFYLYNELSIFTRKYNIVSSAEATRVMNQDGALILDVREKKEFKTGHLKGAQNQPVSSLANKIDSYEKHKDKPVLVYCLSGMRSAGAASQLARAGFTQVHNLRGGIESWKSDSLPVVTS